MILLSAAVILASSAVATTTVKLVGKNPGGFLNGSPCVAYQANGEWLKLKRFGDIKSNSDNLVISTCHGHGGYSNRHLVIKQSGVGCKVVVTDDYSSSINLRNSKNSFSVTVNGNDVLSGFNMNVGQYKVVKLNDSCEIIK